MAGIESRARLSLGPLQYFWKREAVQAFYAQAAHWPVDVVYLGETVCGKRRELRLDDWLRIGRDLRAAGKSVVLSSLALIEAESELSATEAIVENGEFPVEANDLSCVQLCRERRLPFVAGPGLNVYNSRTLEMLAEDGMYRWVPNVEHGLHGMLPMRRSLAALAGAPEIEIVAWGRPALAYSARCFTARAHDLPKDRCDFHCLDHPDGLPLATRDGLPLLNLNGVQVQGSAVFDLAPELAVRPPELADAIVRLSPQAEGMAAVVTRFREALESGIAPPRAGAVNGYWHGTASVPAADTA